MKMSFRIFFSLSMIILMTVLLTIPQAGHAQRMNHPNYNGGGRPSAPQQNRPAPAASHPAPAVNHPPQQMPSHPVEQPRPVENRPTISGGGNVNHDYNQHD